MNPRYLSLAVLLLAGAAQGALAQDQNAGDGQRPPPQTPYTRPWMRPPQGPRPAPAQPPQARTPPPAPPAPAAPAPQPQPQARHEDRGGPRPDWRGPQVVPPAGGWTRPPDARPPQAPQGRPEGRYRDQARPHEYRGDDGRRPDWGRPDDRRPDDRRQDDRWRDRGRPDVDRDRRNDDERRDYNRRDYDRDRREGPRWAPHAYPPNYRSSRRFYGPAWVAPRGYYYRAWRFGEILPRGWYAPDYWIEDWWDFDLPAPPPGYDWVRVGPDALLIEEDTGRIVQVVRYVFW